MKTKRLLALIAFISLLVGCGNTEISQSEESQNTTSTTNSESSEVPKETTTETTTESTTDGTIIIEDIQGSKEDFLKLDEDMQIKLANYYQDFAKAYIESAMDQENLNTESFEYDIPKLNSSEYSDSEIKVILDFYQLSTVHGKYALVVDFTTDFITNDMYFQYIKDLTTIATNLKDEYGEVIDSILNKDAKNQKDNNTKTFIGSTIAMDIPKSWDFDEPLHYDRVYPADLYIYTNGDFCFILEEIDTKNTPDDEIFSRQIAQLWEEETCISVDTLTVGEITYSYSSYSDGNDFHIYSFAHNGYCYQFDVSNLSLFPDGEQIIEDMFNSIIFDENKIQVNNSDSFNKLSVDEQQLAIKTIMWLNSDFTHPKSVKINNCCEYIQQGDKTAVFDISYTTSKNEVATDLFLYSYEHKKSVMLGNSFQSFLDNSPKNDITLFDAEKINKVLNDYYSN